MHRKRILSLSLVVVLGLSLITGCSKLNPNKEETEVSLKNIAVSIGTIKEEVSLSGSVKANKSTSVTATSKSVVEEIYVQSGEEVLKGEDIILLEDGTVIEAPYNGRITKISTYINQDVDMSTVLFSIIDDSSYKIEASIDESDINKVSYGQDVDVTVTALNKGFEGTVTNVDREATLNGSSATFGLVITLDDDEKLNEIYSGMSAEMNIVIKESKDVLIAPIQAVTVKKGVSTVKVKDGDSTKEVEVEVGAQDSSFVEIKSGLKEGDIIVYEEATKSKLNNGFNPNMMDTGKGNNFREMMPSGDRPQMPSGMSGNRPQMPNS